MPSEPIIDVTGLPAATLGGTIQGLLLNKARVLVWMASGGRHLLQASGAGIESTAAGVAGAGRRARATSKKKAKRTSTKKAKRTKKAARPKGSPRSSPAKPRRKAAGKKPTRSK